MNYTFCIDSKLIILPTSANIDTFLFKLSIYYYERIFRWQNCECWEILSLLPLVFTLFLSRFHTLSTNHWRGVKNLLLPRNGNFIISNQKPKRYIFIVEWLEKCAFVVWMERNIQSHRWTERKISLNCRLRPTFDRNCIVSSKYTAKLRAYILMFSDANEIAVLPAGATENQYQPHNHQSVSVAVAYCDKWLGNQLSFPKGNSAISKCWKHRKHNKTDIFNREINISSTGPLFLLLLLTSCCCWWW